MPQSNADESRPYLEVSGLAIERGDHSLITDLTFSADRGQLVHVSGPNGCGKTSLMRAIAGIVIPASGEIRCGGEPIDSHPEFRRELQYIGHRAGLSEHLSAEENLEFLDSVIDLPAKCSAAQALRYFDCNAFIDLAVRHLSAGQRQRVALARLRMFEARLWILDEPFTALDAASRAQMEALIDEHVDADGIVAIATHQGFNSRHRADTINLQPL